VRAHDRRAFARPSAAYNVGLPPRRSTAIPPLLLLLLLTSRPEKTDSSGTRRTGATEDTAKGRPSRTLCRATNTLFFSDQIAFLRQIISILQFDGSGATNDGVPSADLRSSWPAGTKALASSSSCVARFARLPHVFNISSLNLSWGTTKAQEKRGAAL